MTTAKEIVICGLDGVIALIEHRLHFLHNEEGVKEWDRFLAACVDDMPNFPLIDRLNQARAEGVPVMIVTGRSASVREQTEQWLRQWDIGHDALWMRPVGDFTAAVKFKSAIIEQHFAHLTIRRVYESAQHLPVANWCTERNIPVTLITHNQGNGASREQLDLKVIRHACDHVMLHPFYGDDDFTWDDRVEQLAAGPCRRCQAEEQDKERKQRADEARLHARERGLPPLEGSDKQVEWAESIRVAAFGSIDKVRKWMAQVDERASQEDPDHWHNMQQGINRAVAWLEQQTEAKWWIDHRHGISNNRDAGQALLAGVAEDQGFF
jgi:hypothetical protein